MTNVVAAPSAMEIDARHPPSHNLKKRPLTDIPDASTNTRLTRFQRFSMGKSFQSLFLFAHFAYSDTYAPI